MIDVLTNHRPRSAFSWTYRGAGLRGERGVAACRPSRCRQLAQVAGEVSMDDGADAGPAGSTRLPGLGPQQRKWILDATAVAAYWPRRERPRGAPVGVR